MVYRPLSPSEWHARFTQQTRWTQDLRRYLYERVSLPEAQRVLEVGCGTGAALSDEAFRRGRGVFGLDINPHHLALAKRNAPRAALTMGDAHQLPFPPATFDLTFCHFLLLWVAEPLRVVSEMRRVTQPGGAVLALAEPDYGGRIDYPPELEILGRWQTESLRRQGADPLIGRKLAGIFRAAGLQGVESGVLGGQWRGASLAEEQDAEWRILQHDLEYLASDATVQATTIEDLRQRERIACQRGERITFVPTFYAWGRVEP